MAVVDSSGIVIGKATFLFKENGKQSQLLMSLGCLSFLTDLYSKLAFVEAENPNMNDHKNELPHPVGSCLYFEDLKVYTCSYCTIIIIQMQVDDVFVWKQSKIIDQKARTTKIGRSVNVPLRYRQQPTNSSF